MRIGKIVTAIAAGSLVLSSGGAFAQGAEHNQELLDQMQSDRQHGYPPGDPRSANTGAVDYRGYDNRGYDNRRYDNRGYDNHGSDHRGYDRDGRSYYRPDEWRHDGRGAGPSHNWYRGSRLPPAYRSRSYVVDDWRSHRLYAPPRGYQWVQAGGDYMLVAIATGIVAAILLNQ
jgi:Ni/Co efflux regulator RcnB